MRTVEQIARERAQNPTGTFKCLKCETKHKAEYSNLTCPSCGDEKHQERLLQFIDGRLSDKTMTEVQQEIKTAFSGDKQ